MAQSILATLGKARENAFDTAAHFTHRNAQVCHGQRMEFGVSSETVETALLLTVRGDIDLATAPVLWESIEAEWHPGQILVLDLAQVPFMDSTGLSVLVRAAEWAKPQGSRVAVVAATNRVQKVMAITGLDTFIYMGSSVEEALRAT